MFTSLFFKDRIIKWSLISSIFLDALLLVLIYFQIPIRVEPIVLRYNIYVGISLIGPWYQAFYLPLMGFVIIIFNFLLAKMMFLKEKTLAYVLAVVAILCQLSLLATGALLVIVNG
ncbi:hypothetical protein COU23_02565 [Candidatus Kuenenbacteria bacterium CG10_big_fil_rev_8_21_14_0_10_36_11]|uniref:DUF5658 domain-containing protein n=1 Tax=Candidatus Kuenenbacteria bacterium CG10_big_fil_rev_8_21_14_0_10_36_11 TaxID=1974618 RepID=A0A2M6WA89_9BACT|nr:MAG: hypothetical protein COU23_02565 [Candidatus Kuenenbacteria bacterium CG10_big_fil_rev_8_21_14_0_10_36_11]